MKLFQAIHKLNPKIFSIRGTVAYDIDGNEISYDIAKAEELVAKTLYQEKRAEAYPSIADQLDTLYHGGYDAWKATIEAVKNQFPKP